MSYLYRGKLSGKIKNGKGKKNIKTEQIISNLLIFHEYFAVSTTLLPRFDDVSSEKKKKKNSSGNKTKEKKTRSNPTVSSVHLKSSYELLT